MTDKIVVFSACESEQEAYKIARALVEAQLAACVNILPPVTSVYRWQGRIETASEWVLLIKTRREVFESLKHELLRIHSYEVPEVIAVPVVAGSEDYLAWLERETPIT